ncbi:glycine cleavage system aminomethyltransferase GcvT [Metallumcola ferriviriculae]|uniref:Aminomethyltransferase n=1 Tax=Metallumcola ferriviriculae TaxID=3039180 RepID=A0AAU0UM78_9FIRM|nr:glycine cleavage system aminomethyltransferase GcvT [Desulfitibacteraceae bacterium MK1]
MTKLKRTPLYQRHMALGAKMVPFGGWEMPVQYSGIIEEHRQVRENAGLFDVSHMGEIVVEGQTALDTVQQIITNNAERLSPGEILYSPMCQEDGGIIDDLLVYRLEPDKFLLVVNAGNKDKDYQWIKDNAVIDTNVIERSDTYALLALQGPKAVEVMEQVSGDTAVRLKPFTFARMSIKSVDCLVSRTGYTGEDGFEIYCPPDGSGELWDEILRSDMVKPCGLGARDTLRLEASLPLYGHELTEKTTPLEARLKWTVSWDKQFIGKEILEKQRRNGLERKLVGLMMEERGIPREGYEILVGEERVGEVTSGSLAPYLDKYVAMGYVDKSNAVEGRPLAVSIRGRQKKAILVKLPFYKREE